MTVTAADPNVSGSANPEPEDVNAPAVTAMPQRVGSSTVMPPAYPTDVNAPAIDYHTPTTTPGSNTPTWGGEAGPDTVYVPPLVDLTDFPDNTAPAQGGNETQTLTVALPAPVQSNASTATTGGTLAANTYYYVVTATSDEGETTPSNEKSVTTTGSTSTATISWTDGDDPQATGYKIYRGTATGAENKLVGTVSEGTFTWTDTGVAGTTATVPTSNTSAPATFTRTNLVTGAGANPYPNDTNAPTVTPANPPRGGSNTPSWGGEGAPSSNGEQDDLG